MATTITTSKTACHHCGEHCESDLIHFESHSFCCEGCKLVYQILQDNGLCNYYQIEDRPGISLKGRRKEMYAYLEDEDVQTKLIDFQNDEITKVHFHLPQIHCASCVWLLENLHRLQPAVLDAKVNFTKRRLDLTYQHQISSLREIVECLASIGYAPSLNLEQTEKTAAKAVDKKLYYQLGFAGFAFGNIMLFSFPEYLGLDSEDFRYAFSVLNVVLAVPVVAYSGRDYLRSAYLALKHRHLNIDVPIAIGMLSLLGRSLYEIGMGVGAGYLDSLVGLIFFLLVGKWFQQKTYQHISFERDYRSYFPIAVEVKQGQNTEQRPLQKLSIGDTIRVKNQEIIPVDAYLLKGNARIDYSFVTGESEAIRKDVGDKIYAGGRQIGGTIELSVSRKVEQSYLTQLWNHHAFKKQENQSTQLADTIGRWFTYAILTIAVITLLYWLPKDMATAINAFTSVLIIACPCAVALSIPFTYGNMLRLLSRHQLYLKNIQVIDRLQRISDVVFDKTGTLTNNEARKVQFVGKKLNFIQKHAIKALTQESAHPLSRSITQSLTDVRVKNNVAIDFEEVVGKGVKGQVVGQEIRIGAADFMLDLDNKIEKAQSGVYVEIEHELLGYFEVKASYRTGFAKVLEALQKHFNLHLLSGDRDSERSFLSSYFKAENLHFRQSPQDKLQFIEKLQSKNQGVLMLGDGLNDAGALQQSDVGIVLSENLNNFSPACDAILAAEKLEKLPKLLAFIRSGQRVVFLAYALAVIYNIIGLSFAVQGLLSPVIAAILMPVSSVTIVLTGIIGSSLLSRIILDNPHTTQTNL